MPSLPTLLPERFMLSSLSYFRQPRVWGRLFNPINVMRLDSRFSFSFFSLTSLERVVKRCGTVSLEKRFNPRSNVSYSSSVSSPSWPIFSSKAGKSARLFADTWRYNLRRLGNFRNMSNTKVNPRYSRRLFQSCSWSSSSPTFFSIPSQRLFIAWPSIEFSSKLIHNLVRSRFFIFRS